MGKTVEKKFKESLKRKPNQRLCEVNKHIKTKVDICKGVNYEDVKDIILEAHDYDINLYRIRIFESNLRVTDFSLCNCIIEELEDRILFRFSFKGHPLNWVYFNSNSSITINNKNNTIELKVDGPVYWADGSRRYDNRLFHENITELYPIFCKDDIEQSKIQECNTEAQKEKKTIRKLIEIFNEDFVFEDD